MLHWKAWEMGVKSLYYCRSKSVQRAGFAGQANKEDNVTDMGGFEIAQTDYEECLSCQ